MTVVENPLACKFIQKGNKLKFSLKSAFSKSLCSGRNRKVPGRFPEANPEAKQGIAKTCVPEAKRKVPGRFPEANPEGAVHFRIMHQSF